MSERSEERTSVELRRLTEVFVELADILTEGFDVVGYLGVLASRCVELLPVASAGVLMADHDGRLRPAAASDEPAWLLVLWQAQRGEGPCLDCSRSGSGIANVALDAATTRWPDFAAQARGYGYARTHAIPMRQRAALAGILALFSATPEPLGEADLGLGQALADVTAVGIAQRRAMARGAEATSQLREALSSKILIEQAKGILAERMQLHVDDAFAVLRNYARQSNRPLPAVARAVVEGGHVEPRSVGTATTPPTTPPT
jgi:GAF domain-containing protein